MAIPTDAVPAALEKNTNTISFEEFLALPETKPASEYINGNIYQKPMPQAQHSCLLSRNGYSACVRYFGRLAVIGAGCV